jgi:hypothetical protein
VLVDCVLSCCVLCCVSYSRMGMGIVPLKTGISEESVIDSAQCINRAILCPRSNYVDHISEDFFVLTVR